MPRLAARSRETLPEFEPMFQIAEQTIGFVPNSLLTLVHKPELARAAMALFQVVQGPGRVSSDLKSLLAHVASRAAGCQYCQAHTGHTAERLGVAPEKIEALWSFEDSPLFAESEKAALRVARHGAQTPNTVTDTEFEALQRHFDAEQIVEIVAVVAMFGFLNRWNATMATELEASPRQFGEAHLARAGWQVGPHGAEE